MEEPRFPALPALLLHTLAALSWKAIPGAADGYGLLLGTFVDREGDGARRSALYLVDGCWTADQMPDPDAIRSAMARAPEVQVLTPEQREESDRALENLRDGRANLVRDPLGHGAPGGPFLLTQGTAHVLMFGQPTDNTEVLYNVKRWRIQALSENGRLIARAVPPP